MRIYRGQRGAGVWVAVVAALLICGPSVAQGFRFTHKVDLKITVSDRWTRTPRSGCGIAGSGGLNVTIVWRRQVKALPQINAAAGRWVLLVPGPGGHSVLDLAPQRVTGRVTYTNRLSIGGGLGCAGSVDRRGCRTYPATGTSDVFGADGRFLTVLSTLHLGDQIRPRGSCLLGEYQGLSDANLFDGRRLSIRMPAPSVLRTRHRLVLRRSNAAHVRDETFVFGSLLEETVKQTATVTFTQIAH